MLGHLDLQAGLEHTFGDLGQGQQPATLARQPVRPTRSPPSAWARMASSATSHHEPLQPYKPAIQLDGVRETGFEPARPCGHQHLNPPGHLLPSTTECHEIPLSRRSQRPLSNASNRTLGGGRPREVGNVREASVTHAGREVDGIHQGSTKEEEHAHRSTSDVQPSPALVRQRLLWCASAPATRSRPHMPATGAVPSLVSS